MNNTRCIRRVWRRNCNPLATKSTRLRRAYVTKTWGARATPDISDRRGHSGSEIDRYRPDGSRSRGRFRRRRFSAPAIFSLFFFPGYTTRRGTGDARCRRKSMDEREDSRASISWWEKWTTFGLGVASSTRFVRDRTPIRRDSTKGNIDAIFLPAAGHMAASRTRPPPRERESARTPLRAEERAAEFFRRVYRRGKSPHAIIMPSAFTHRWPSSAGQPWVVRAVSRSHPWW